MAKNKENKAKRRLTDIDVFEVALEGETANEEDFIVWKRAKKEEVSEPDNNENNHGGDEMKNKEKAEEKVELTEEQIKQEKEKVDLENKNKFEANKALIMQGGFKPPEDSSPETKEILQNLEAEVIEQPNIEAVEDKILELSDEQIASISDEIKKDKVVLELLKERETLRSQIKELQARSPERKYVDFPEDKEKSQKEQIEKMEKDLSDPNHLKNKDEMLNNIAIGVMGSH